MAKIKDLRSMTVDELEAKLVEAKKNSSIFGFSSLPASCRILQMSAKYAAKLQKSTRF